MRRNVFALIFAVLLCSNHAEVSVAKAPADDFIRPKGRPKNPLLGLVVGPNETITKKPANARPGSVISSWLPALGFAHLLVGDPQTVALEMHDLHRLTYDPGSLHPGSLHYRQSLAVFFITILVAGAVLLFFAFFSLCVCRKRCCQHDSMTCCRYALITRPPRWDEPDFDKLPRPICLSLARTVLAVLLVSLLGVVVLSYDSSVTSGRATRDIVHDIDEFRLTLETGPSRRVARLDACLQHVVDAQAAFAASFKTRASENKKTKKKINNNNNNNRLGPAGNFTLYDDDKKLQQLATASTVNLELALGGVKLLQKRVNEVVATLYEVAHGADGSLRLAVILVVILLTIIFASGLSACFALSVSHGATSEKEALRQGGFCACGLDSNRCAIRWTRMTELLFLVAFLGCMLASATLLVVSVVEADFCVAPKDALGRWSVTMQEEISNRRSTKEDFASNEKSDFGEATTLEKNIEDFISSSFHNALQFSGLAYWADISESGGGRKSPSHPARNGTIMLLNVTHAYATSCSTLEEQHQGAAAKGNGTSSNPRHDSIVIADDSDNDSAAASHNMLIIPIVTAIKHAGDAEKSLEELDDSLAQKQLRQQNNSNSTFWSELRANIDSIETALQKCLSDGEEVLISLKCATVAPHRFDDKDTVHGTNGTTASIGVRNTNAANAGAYGTEAATSIRSSQWEDFVRDACREGTVAVTSLWKLLLLAAALLFIIVAVTRSLRGIAVVHLAYQSLHAEVKLDRTKGWWKGDCVPAFEGKETAGCPYYGYRYHSSTIAATEPRRGNGMDMDARQQSAFPNNQAQRYVSDAVLWLTKTGEYDNNMVCSGGVGKTTISPSSYFRPSQKRSVRQSRPLYRGRRASSGTRDERYLRKDNNDNSQDLQDLNTLDVVYETCDLSMPPPSASDTINLDMNYFNGDSMHNPLLR
tara:strand:- start:2434 stop:5229 length:2796 start_codon:yes stop_codon:yes gene_type:complete